MRIVSRINNVAATASLSAIVLAAACSDSFSALMEFDRQAILAGEWWRLATGHFVHWGADHCCWDLLMFAMFGGVCELRSRRRLLICLALAVVAISCGIWWLLPEVNTYRGLSGLDSALFTMAVIGWLCDAADSPRSSLAAISAIALVGFAGKLAFEIFTGTTLFVDSTAAGFVPLPSVHVIGGLVGAVVGFPWRLRDRIRMIRPAHWQPGRAALTPACER